MHVVVMDLVVGYDRPLSDADRKAQGRVVDLPHRHGVVFRDLSTLNTPATPGGRVLLIDLEWFGKVSKVRYLGDFYVANEVCWDRDAKGGGLIEKVHDECLDKLTAPEGHEP